MELTQLYESVDASNSTNSNNNSPNIGNNSSNVSNNNSSNVSNNNSSNICNLFKSKKLLSLDKDLGYYLLLNFFVYINTLLIFNLSKNIVYILRDIPQLCIYSTAGYILTNNIGKMYAYNIINIIITLVSSIIFSMLDYIKFFNNFILKYEYMIKWNTLNWIIFSIITLILGLSIIYHIYINRKHRMKFTLIKLFLIISYTALYIGLMVYKDINFHIHHWYIGFIFSVICDNDKILSQLLHYIFLGIYIQGVSVYNIANLYDN